MMLEFRPFPVVLSAPSGAGKTSLARALVGRHADFAHSVSATTRTAREDERPDVDYQFVGEDEFDRMVDDDEFVEWAHVHGRRYGTPWESIRMALDADEIVVLDIDVQGARQIREAFPGAVLIFILPPSADELDRRLSGRGSEGDADRRRRLGNALDEFGVAVEFDYVIVNDEFDAAVERLEAIVAAERRRVGRTRNLERCVQHLTDEVANLLRGDS